MNRLLLFSRSLSLVMYISNALAYMSTPSPLTVPTVYASHVVDDPSATASVQEFLSSHQRMDLVDTFNQQSKSALVQEVRSLEDYKRAIIDEADGSLVAVYFYAPWCVACRASLPGIASMAKKHPNVKFIKVPALEENANLHQGLNVPSVPFLHLYHPTAGLVEEVKIVRKYLPRLNTMLEDYATGSCSLERSGEWSALYKVRSPKKLFKIPTTFNVAKSLP